MASLGDTLELSLIKRMELLAAGRPGAVSLAQGIPSFDTPEPVKRGAVEAIQSGRAARYSLAPGLLELREHIEEHLERDGMAYDFENEIIITAGSIEAITATLLAILEPDDEVLIASPSYTSYVQAIRVARGVPVFVPLDEAAGWGISAEQFRARLGSRTKAILLCNPNNPTGTILSRETLLAIGQLAADRGLTILSDEVYRDLIFDPASRRSYFTLAAVPALRQQVVRIFSFSKSYAMTGWRVGYLHTDRRLATRILKVHDSLVTCAPVVSQYAALAALQMKPTELQPYLDEYLARRTMLCDGLDQLSDYLSYVRPPAAYFAFPRLRTDRLPRYRGSAKFAEDLLQEGGLAAVPGAAFGPEGEDHVRLSFGRSREEISEGLHRLTAYLHHLCAAT